MIILDYSLMMMNYKKLDLIKNDWYLLCQSEIKA